MVPFHKNNATYQLCLVLIRSAYSGLVAIHRQLAICRRLKHLRDASGYTQKLVADYLSVSQAAYSRLEKGEIEISLTKLLALSELYSLPVSKMLDDI